MCTDMCTDMCSDMCMDLCIGICIDVCIDTHGYTLANKLLHTCLTHMPTEKPGGTIVPADSLRDDYCAYP